MSASGAVISGCGLFRYHLWRSLGLRHLTDGRGPRVAFLMLNPSTADGTTNDRTIDTIMDFSRRWHFEWLDVVNLYAFRSRKPSLLWTAADPVGPDNDAWIRRICSRATLTVCGWGGNARPDRVAAVQGLFGDVDGMQVRALHINADGSPKHPLYIKRETELVPYPPRRAVAAQASESRS